jgi:FKBP-type peptidyl-prolyl cis-trans isomerase FkpA
MKVYFLLPVIFFISINSNAANKDSVYCYSLPDSVKVAQFMVEMKIKSIASKQFSFGISASGATLRFIDIKGKRRIVFSTDYAFNPAIAIGNGVTANRSLKGLYFYFNHNWQLNKVYKLLIASATDSAANFHLSSAYIFLPDENKWKFIGTLRHQAHTTLKNLCTSSHKSRKGFVQYEVDNTWIQRSNGTWKNLKNDTPTPPVINWFGHIDSLTQSQIDIKQIEDSINAGKTDATQKHEGLYYTILKEGTGRQVKPTDTVTIHYKGYLFSDGTIFDQTKDKPATFPLSRLILGWQIGVPLCKVGSRIKLVIPSGLAYTIRTRAAKIPPNSILVFEIEVVDTKEAK